MKTLKRSSTYCNDSTQACHPHQENGQTRDLQTPCRSLYWPHNGRSCPVLKPRQNKIFPQELPCSCLATSARSLCGASHRTAGQLPHGFEAGNEVLPSVKAAASAGLQPVPGPSGLGAVAPPGCLYLCTWEKLTAVPQILPLLWIRRRDDFISFHCSQLSGSANYSWASEGFLSQLKP